MYRRLRALYSGNWGMGQATGCTINQGVFLPRITFAAEIWQEGVKLGKSVKKLLSAQRVSLRATTGAYNISSTNILAAVASILLLDLEVRHQVLRRNLSLQIITVEKN